MTDITETTKKKKDGRGGARPGAGRPKGDKECFAFKVGGEAARLIKSHPNRSNFIIDCILEHMARMEEEWEEEELSLVAQNMRSVPRYNFEVACGMPTDVTDDWPDEIKLPEEVLHGAKEPFACYAWGDSMIDADIQTGDLLVFDRANREPRGNQPALCFVNNAATLKYVRVTQHGVELVPANPDFSVMSIGPEDNFQVWAVLVYSRRERRW